MVDPGRKTRGQGTHRGLRKLGAPQLFRDMRDLAGRNSLDHPLHQRQNQGLFRALIVSEQLRRKASVPGQFGEPGGSAFPLGLSAVFSDTRFDIPSDRSSVHDAPLPDVQPSGLPEPGSIPIRPASSFLRHHSERRFGKRSGFRVTLIRPLFLLVENRLFG